MFSPMASPIVQLLQANLRNPRVRFFPHVPPAAMARATSMAGRGLDHHGGEELVGIVDDRMEELKGNVLVLTDRRFFGVSGPKLFSVPWQVVSDVVLKRDFLEASYEIQTVDGVVTVPKTAAMEAVFPFLAGLRGVDPAHRGYGTVALAKARDDDPSGALGALARALWPDASLDAALRYVHAAHRLGWADLETSCDAAARLALFNRTQWLGRATRLGAWVSPLGLSDAAYGLATVLGAPCGQRADGERTSFEFRIMGRFRDAYDDTTSLRAAVAQSIDQLRVGVTPMEYGVLLTFEDGSLSTPQSITIGAPRLFQRIHEALLAFEAHATWLRAVLGWSWPIDALVMQGVPQAQQRMHAAFSGPPT